MSILDWSDPEEMLGLLAEYVRDELRDETSDRERARFLKDLSLSLRPLTGDMSTANALHQLRAILDSQSAEFAGDDVLRHVADCIAELERIVADAR